MQSVFLSFHFSAPTDADQHDKTLAGHVDLLLRSHGLNVVSGGTLGGGALTKAVMDRIEGCEALVALMTRRDQLQPASNGAPAKFSTHSWVRDEINHARGRNRLTIALIENGVEHGGAYQEHEWIPYDRIDPLPAVLKLTDTLGLWRRDSGRSVPIQILPPALAQKVGDAASTAVCEYRQQLAGKPPSSWNPMTVVPMKGGTFVYADGVRDGTLLQVRVSINGNQYVSKAGPQELQVELKKGQA
jgi:hypothetical protein